MNILWKQLLIPLLILRISYAGSGCLSAKNELNQQLKEKYLQSDLKQKYFLSKIEPSLQIQLSKEVLGLNNDSLTVLIKTVYDTNTVNETELNTALQSVTSGIYIDVQMQILLEDIERALLQTRFVNKTADEVVREVLNNFSNAIILYLTAAAVLVAMDTVDAIGFCGYGFLGVTLCFVALAAYLLFKNKI